MTDDNFVKQGTEGVPNRQPEDGKLEGCLKYEAEEWIPEDGFDEED